VTLIKVPKPPQSAIDPSRPINALLRNQILHLQEAEFRLPVRMQTNIYINAIKTEGEAADYIRRVTAALHHAHGKGPSGVAAAEVPVVTPRRLARGRDIAASVEEPSKRAKPAGKRKKKGRPKK